MQGCVAGIDEVGRGCLAGPVVAAAVVFAQDGIPDGLADSKSLSARRRQALAIEIKSLALAWSIGRAEAGEIDRLNIHHATLHAMQRAFSGLLVQPTWLEVDGKFFPEVDCPGRAIVQGDRRVPAIAAASILAKVSRDFEMRALDAFAPIYGFRLHKGYPTALHFERLARFGPSAWHRRSFRPVARLIF